jgi:hypothetical protein
MANDLYSTIIGQTKYNAAIVIEHNNQRQNLADFKDFFQDQSSICFNGDIELAYLIALEIEQNIWIYDEYTIDSIELNQNKITFNVLDLFTYDNYGSNPERKHEFIESYIAGKCN